MPSDAHADYAPAMSSMSPDQSALEISASAQKETKAIAVLALVTLAALSAWSWTAFLTFKPDSINDYGNLVGELEATQEHLQQHGANQSGYLDIKVKGSDIVYRVPRDGYFDYFNREAFFKEAHHGDMIELWARNADLVSPKKIGNAHVVFVRVVKIGEVTYCDFSDHVAWQVRNNSWILLFALALSLGGVLVLCGLLVTARTRSPANLESNYSPLRFTGKGSDLFSGNGLISSLALISILGFPLWAVYFNRWIAKHTATAKRESFSFVGPISVAYGIVILGLVVQLTQQYLPLDKFYELFGSTTGLWAAIVFVALIFFALQGAVAYLQFCYFVDNLRWPDGRQMQVDIPVLKFILIQILGVLSFFTVIGWAWWSVWCSRWLANRITAQGVGFRFVGTGFQLLWRTMAALTVSIPLLTIPWTIAWFLRWFVSSVEIKETESVNEPMVSRDAMNIISGQSPLKTQSPITQENFQARRLLVLNSVCLSLAFVLLSLVAPVFEQMFIDFGTKLPSPTEIFLEWRYGFLGVWGAFFVSLVAFYTRSRNQTLLKWGLGIQVTFIISLVVVLFSPIFSY